MYRSFPPTRELSATWLLTYLATLQQAVLQRDSEYALKLHYFLRSLGRQSPIYEKPFTPVCAPLQHLWLPRCLPGPGSPPGLSPVAENFLPQEIGLILRAK